MKKILLYICILFASVNVWSQVTINETGGWMESAFVKWAPVTNATSYNVYYTGGSVTNQKIDTQLIRSYGTYFRADVLGLAAGTYTLTIKPVVSGTEQAGTTTSAITVLAHDRTGFAFQGGRVPGGYSATGTPKSGAVILYITANTKNTVSFDIITSSKGTTTNYVGLQNILYGIKKGLDTRPFIFRLIGNITDMTVMEGGDITIENANNANSYLTIEGVGSDAVVNGMGVRLKSASNIEVSNLGFMNCNSTAGDDIGMQQDNDHIWVHNNDLFYGDAGSDADQVKGDGAMDNKNSTYCTFSYNHFWDNGKASLLGLSEGTTVGLYVTYHHNWFDHSDSRHPRVRFYSAHIYNNYFDGNAKYGSGSTNGSSLFVEGNYYRNAKHPMMTSMQGTDIWDETKQINDAGNLGTFSGEAGGTIKAFNNTFVTDIATNNMRFVAYGDTNPLYNISGKINSTTDFDAYVPATRGESVPNTVVSKLGGNKYNNFDTDPSLYIKNLVIDDPATAKTKVTQYAGRVSGGDLKWTFTNSADDVSYLVITGLKTALTNYTPSLASVQGEGAAVVTNTQTLALTSSANANQTVASGTAISSIIYTWGGDATDASVTGIPASGIAFIKNSTTKTITITGTPTAGVSYSVTTSGTLGTPVTASGTISLSTAQLLTTPLNANQTVTPGTAISSIVFTWGGVATDATVTGLPDSGLTFAKDAVAKTITITGTPSANVSYSITTSGPSGTPVTGSGTITVSNAPTSTGDEIHNFTTDDLQSSFYTITGNLSTQYGSVTYNNLALMTQCLKMETATNISFTAAGAGTLTLVFNKATGTGSIKVDGVTKNQDTNGIITVAITAGAHTIIKGSGGSYLFYMRTDYTSTLGLEQNAQAPKLTLYPNPVTNQLFLSSSDQKIENAAIYNLTGALVKTISNEVESIDVSNLTPGNYLVKVTTEQGSFTQKIIKK
jgi:pectate lyase